MAQVPTHSGGVIIATVRAAEGFGGRGKVEAGKEEGCSGLLTPPPKVVKISE